MMSVYFFTGIFFTLGFNAFLSQVADDFVTANSNRFNIEKFHTMSAAFDFAVSIAKPHDTILLSPATASYDQYKNYIERGRDFDKLVKEYEVKTKKE